MIKMTKNTKITIGVGVGILLLLWLRNRNKSVNTLKEGGAGESESEGGGGGAIGGGGGGGSISPNALGGANTIITPVVVGVPTQTTRPLFNRPLPVSTGRGRGFSKQPLKPLNTDPIVSKPLPTSPAEVQPVSTKADTSFARFDGSFRSPSGLDFDGHIED